MSRDYDAKGSIQKSKRKGDNLSVPNSGITKKKVLSQVRRSTGCDIIRSSGKENMVQKKKQLQKSTSMAWIARGGHGKQPSQLEEISNLRKNGDCPKSTRGSPSNGKVVKPNDSNSWANNSLDEADKKDYSITSIEQELLKQIGKSALFDASGFTDEKSYAEDQMMELMKRCPYIEQLKQTSEKYRTVLVMLRMLARYNELMKKLLERNIVVASETELEKYSEFLKKNRNLRIELKILLTEQKEENQRKIDEMKRNINVFGIHPRLSQTCESSTAVEKRGSIAGSGTGSTTKRELIKFRDYLLEENDGLLFQLKRKLL